ncbi:MAG: AAA family ATPase [Pseudomonadota bacterium]
MYAPFFGLKHEPFSIAPDPRFLFMSERHREALAHLLYGLRGGGGFVLLTGEIGAGKTTVCRCFLEQIPKRCNVAYIFNPKLTVEELLRSVCDEFRVPCEHQGAGVATVKDYVDALNNFLLRTHAVGQNNVLIIDEAQNLSADVLEQLRLLTNLETSERKLLQIILIGQPELRAMLARPELEQLAQRVIARYHLDALSERETEQYIAHRLGVAGMRKAMPFDRAALRAIHSISRGVPRRINLLCDRALLGAYATGKATIDRRVVERASSEVFDAPPRRVAALWPRARRYPAVGVGLGMAAGAAMFGVVAMALDGGWRSASPAIAAAAPPASAVAAGRPASTAASSAASSPLQSGAAGGALSWGGLIQSEKEAWRQLAAAWNLALPDGDPCQAAQQEQVQCFRSNGSSLAQIRQLDRPVILTLYEAAGSRPVYALLTGLSEHAVTLRSAEAAQTVSLAALAGAWRGEFSTLWRAPPGYSSAAAVAEPGPLRDWLVAQLSKSAPSTALAAAAPGGGLAQLKSRIAAFQLAQGLKPDGLAGPITFMQLNRAAGVDEPRLRQPR